MLCKWCSSLYFVKKDRSINISFEHCVYLDESRAWQWTMCVFTCPQKRPPTVCSASQGTSGGGMGDWLCTDAKAYTRRDDTHAHTHWMNAEKTLFFLLLLALLVTTVLSGHSVRRSCSMFIHSRPFWAWPVVPISYYVCG